MNSAVIYLKAEPDDRVDSAGFVQLIKELRLKHFGNRMDVKIAQGASNLSEVLRILPLRVRRKVARLISRRTRFTMQISCLGSLTPGGHERGKQWQDFTDSNIGDLFVSEIHGIGHALALDIPVRIWAWFLRDRLKLLLTAKGRHFSRSGAQELLDLIVETLMEDPFGKAAENAVNDM
jgi:hypothetical protein